MAKEQVIYDTGKMPVDLSNNEIWMGGDMHFEEGICTFEFLGWSNVDGQKKQVDLNFKILNGPETDDPERKDANKDKVLRRRFTVDNTGSMNFMKAVYHTMGGPECFVAGKPELNIVGHTIFKARLFDKPYMRKDKSGQEVERHGYDIDLNTVVVVRKGRGDSSTTSAGAQGGAFAPVQ